MAEHPGRYSQARKRIEPSGQSPPMDCQKSTHKAMSIDVPGRAEPPPDATTSLYVMQGSQNRETREYSYLPYEGKPSQLRVFSEDPRLLACPLETGVCPLLVVGYRRLQPRARSSAGRGIVVAATACLIAAVAGV